MQEAEKLIQHFKDPEFCRLFQELAKELTDPQVGSLSAPFMMDKLS